MTHLNRETSQQPSPTFERVKKVYGTYEIPSKTTICTFWDSQKEKTERENLFKEIMTENFKKWGEKLKSRFIRFKSPQLG